MSLSLPYVEFMHEDWYFYLVLCCAVSVFILVVPFFSGRLKIVLPIAIMSGFAVWLGLYALNAMNNSTEETLKLVSDHYSISDVTIDSSAYCTRGQGEKDVNIEWVSNDGLNHDGVIEINEKRSGTGCSVSLLEELDDGSYVPVSVHGRKSEHEGNNSSIW